ncbi:ABC transporter [Nitzschia inconspicua]|uniref:ABC transporter n=1 Tax=Nitzschia inconspicua TaxID=303405 RepID=A0A9K3M1G8_9STRA|nr:ABC transporter [Nitzschia inconspicua]
MTIKDDENNDQSEVEETAVTDHDEAEDQPLKREKKKNSKKKKSKKNLEDDGVAKPKKKKSKKKHDDVDDDEGSDEDDHPKEKSVKKKKSKKESSIMDIEAQVTASEEAGTGKDSTLTIPTAISTTGQIRRSGFDSRQSSMLATSDDPFAIREGKTLLWRNVNMTLKTKDGADRKLLDDVWGEVPEKQTTAIMGPSGAGKTSLLNILAGRAKTRGKVTISSDVRLNNFSVNPTDISVRKHIAFVAQDDSLQVTSTPREAIYFSAKLRLPRNTPEENLQKLVRRMLTELGLENCADTYVGGALLKGISGGERKRCSVGVELVVRPAMVFLDEPTSGLDSFSAIQLCQVLKKVANAGSSVLFTIHQPASEIFNAFDRLILMNKGRVMYQGLVEDVPSYFRKRNHPLPKNYNPADWIMNVAQANTMQKLDEDGFFPKDTRDLPEPFAETVEGKDELGITLTEHHLEKDFDARPPGVFTQVRMLFTREIKNIKRDTAAVGARFGLTIFLGILIGLIFRNVGKADPSQPQNLNSIFGALLMVLLMSMFGTAQPALLAFPEERPVFLREYSTNHYSVVSYFIARFSMEAVVTGLQILVQLLITFWFIGFQSSFGMLWVAVYALAMSSTALSVLLGCAVEDPKLGQEMLPLLFVPQMLFAGFFVAPDLIPSWLRWARYLCTLTYAIRIALVEEFGDGCPSDDGSDPCLNLLNSIGAEPDETWWNWLVLVALFATFRLFALVVLQQKATKFF